MTMARPVPERVAAQAVRIACRARRGSNQAFSAAGGSSPPSNSWIG